MNESEEDLVVAVGVVNGEGDVFFLLAHPEQVEEGVYCGKNEGDNGPCQAETFEGALLGGGGGVGELEGTGEDQGEELVEDQGVEVEVGSPVEGHLEVPLHIAGQSALPGYAIFRNEEHKEEVGHESTKHYSDVVNISEEVDIGVVLVEVGIGAVVELEGEGSLPLRGNYCYILVLDLAETGEDLPEEGWGSEGGEVYVQPYFLEIVHEVGGDGLQSYQKHDESPVNNNSGHDLEEGPDPVDG